jgi:restriction endonuclease S subunit
LNRPFDEAKYNALLEGREIIELKLSELENEFTIGSEYYKREFVEAIETIEKSAFEKLQLKNCTDLITDGDHGQAVYEDSGILYLLSESIKEGYIDLTGNGVRFISSKIHKELKRSELKPGNVVVTKTGVYFGKSSVIPKEIQTANTSAHVGKIIVKENLLNPYYLSTFLNSKFGYSQLRRRGIKVSRPEIKLIEFQDILIAIPSFKLQERVEEVILKGQSVVEQSKQTYKQAENLLLEAIGLKDFEPSKEKTNVKNFSNSFLSTGRLDAEYYQAKYEQVVNHITRQKHAKLVKLVNIKKSIEPGSAHYSDEGLPFLRVADYNKFGITEPNKKLSTEFCAEHAKLIETLKPKRNTILFSKDGSVGTAYRLREDLEMITSGAVLHLTIKDGAEVLPDYLTLALNSKLVQMQAERDAGGSIILHWRTEEIENVVVPVIAAETQEKISELIEESFWLKKESENLLEIAKSAVEMAIEETEEKAIEFIKAEIN